MKPKIILIIFLLTVLFSIPLFSLFYPGLPVTHDGQDHVARIANFYQSLSEGNIVPRWAANLNWGYGHPILMFLYPLPSYIASLFHFFGLSFVDSTKAVFAVSYIGSVLAMFLWMKKQWGIYPAIVASVVYAFAPYRFVDLYVRGAVGEHMAFVFPPLVCLGILMLAKMERIPMAIAITSLGTAGLILSHNALSIMFFPVIALYGVYLYFFEAKKRKGYLVLGLLSLGEGLLLSAFFWMPAFFEGKYTLRDIVTKGDFTNRFVPWTWFFYSNWNYGGGGEFSKQIGILNWIGVLLTPIFFKKAKKPMRWLFLGSIMIFILTVFLMTQFSQAVWETVTILQKFQFPWRFLSISVFITSVLLAAEVKLVSKKYLLYTTIGAVFLALSSTFFMWHPKDYQQKPESFYSGIYPGTTDTGESSPIWSVRFMEKQAITQYEIIEGKGIITPQIRNTTVHQFTVNPTTKARIVDNTLYFPGWVVAIDNVPSPVEFQDQNWRGLMTFWVEPGMHTITIAFGDTKLRSVANYISIAGLLSLIIMISMVTLKKRYA